MNAPKRKPHAGCGPIWDSGDLECGGGHPAYRNLFFRGFGHELWPNGVCTTAGVRALCSLRTLGGQVPSQPMDARLHCVESLHLHGLCTIHKVRGFA